MSPATKQTSENPGIPSHARNPDDPTYVRNKPCSHAIHPGITNYPQRPCPICRIHSAINDVKVPHDQIMSNGGIEEWLKKAKGAMEYYDLVRTYNGPRPEKDEGYPQLNIYAQNTCFRSAKARLHSLVNELEERAEQENSWEWAKLGIDLATTRETRWMYSATRALELFNRAVEKGTITKVQDTSSGIGKKRGREWEAINQPDFPDAGEEIDYTERTKDPCLDLTDAQREFVETHSKKDEPTTASAIEPGPQRRRRNFDAKVSFNEDTYVRSEAEIDNLRWQCEDERDSAQGRSASMPLPRSILRTSTVKNDPRPRRPHYIRPLRHEGKDDTCSKRKFEKYKPSDWTIPSDSEQVDTSGKRLPWEDWDQLMDWEMREGYRVDLRMQLEDQLARRDELYAIENSGEELTPEEVEELEELEKVTGDYRGMSGDEEMSDDDDELSDEKETNNDEEDQPEGSLLEQQDGMPPAQDLLQEWSYVEVDGLKEAICDFPRARLKYS